jgi:hypothetical protein
MVEPFDVNGYDCRSRFMNRRPPSRRTAEGAVAALGAALVFLAIAANQAWLDRHFLPSFLISRRALVSIEIVVRIACAISGITLMLAVRGASARLLTRYPWRAFQIVAAVLLAFAASELALQRVHLRPTEWRILDEEPRRQPDPRLGWTFIPGRTAYATSGGRKIEYAFDAHGYRVRDVHHPVDPERPSVIFGGESVMFGDGLTYDESVPAQVEAMLGLQAVNMGVYGYSTDQTFMKLRAELPRFRRPVAVVALFMTALFGRNLDDDRPHLGPGLEWLPAEEHARIVSLAGLVVPFRRVVTVETGIAVTRAALRGLVDLARARNATPLIVVPQLGYEGPPARALRRRILDETGLPYVFVELDPTWHVPWDRHPDARAASKIATAIAVRLKSASPAG